MSGDDSFVLERQSHWRMSLALALWIGGFFLPLAIPLVAAQPLPVATKVALSGLLVFGLPQVLTVKSQSWGRRGFITSRNGYSAPQGSSGRRCT